MIARTGRFLTFSAARATIGYRMREDPAERAALRIVRETDAGVVIRGKIGMHTSPAYAEDVYIGALSASTIGEHRATFIVPVNAPGVTVICRKIAARDPNPFVVAAQQPLRRARRADVARRRAHPVGPRVPASTPRRSRSRAGCSGISSIAGCRRREFTLGLALACTHAMGLVSARGDDRVPARPDHRRADGAQLPDRGGARSAVHAGRLLLSQPLPSRGRQHRHAEGAPAHERDPAHRARLLAGRRADRPRSRRRRRWPRAWRSRSAAAATPRCSVPRCCRWRGTMSSSALDGRESAFELHANGGMPVVARPPAPRLRPLQRAGQRRAAPTRPWRCRRSISVPCASSDTLRGGWSHRPRQCHWEEHSDEASPVRSVRAP